MRGIINRKREKKIDYNKYIVTSFCNILLREIFASGSRFRRDCGDVRLARASICCSPMG